MNKFILTAITAALALASSVESASASAANYNHQPISELREGRASSTANTVTKSSSQISNQKQSKHGSHSHQGGGWYDPAKEMRSALKHIWQEHRFDSARRGGRYNSRNGGHQEHDEHHYKQQKNGGGKHRTQSYAWQRYDDPHFVRYYDNDFYVYLNDPYYREHMRGPWWGHYHRGDYCNSKHRYLLHDDMRNLMMLGLVVDFTR